MQLIFMNKSLFVTSLSSIATNIVENPYGDIFFVCHVTLIIASIDFELNINLLEQPEVPKYAVFSLQNKVHTYWIDEI